jgi:Rieske Fe-S protein
MAIDPEEKEPELKRREVLRILLGCAAAGQIGFLTSCGGSDPETRVPLEQVPIGRRVRVRHQGDAVELLRSEEGIVARSLRCTHQKCEVFWNATENVYRCPCHPAQFDPEGRPLSGPVSEPLAMVPVRIEGSTVILGTPDP